MSPFESGFRHRAVTPQPTRFPRTPDPLGDDSTSQPPPPPRARLRLRRKVPNLKANTPQFLESVSSADVPIPSIEEPHVYDEEEMHTDLEPTSTNKLSLPQLSLKPKSLSPPRTPAPENNLSVGLNWYQTDLESLEYPESEASRPSTARSSGTFASVFSHLSSQYGYSGEGLQQTPFSGDIDMTIKASAHGPTSKRAHWSKATEQHLWKTYLRYQQDATVTPYKVGANNVPPGGVLDRVATMARQTWKQTCAKASYGMAPVVEWPHSRAAARAHLRELCISQARKASRAPQLRERSTTPAFPTAIRFKNRRLGPTPSPCPFAGRDMAMSLAVSTADSMQPEGPLAQLARSGPAISMPEDLPSYELSSSLMSLEPLEAQRPRLASPFAINTYGPSTSLPTIEKEVRIQPQTVALPASYCLASPVQVDEQKLTGKRRARPSLPEPPKAKRPSLTSDLWKDPSMSQQESSPLAPLPEPSSPPYPIQQQREIEGPHLNLLEQLNAITDQATDMETDANPGSEPEFPPLPRRLGSPFTGRLSSFSFPGRISRPREVPRTFATVNGVTAGKAKTPRTPVPRRALEDKLRDFCRRARWRSPTPQ